MHSTFNTVLPWYPGCMWCTNCQVLPKLDLTARPLMHLTCAADCAFDLCGRCSGWQWGDAVRQMQWMTMRRVANVCTPNVGLLQELYQGKNLTPRSSFEPVTPSSSIFQLEPRTPISSIFQLEINIIILTSESGILPELLVSYSRNVSLILLVEKRKQN